MLASEIKALKLASVDYYPVTAETTEFETENGTYRKYGFKAIASTVTMKDSIGSDFPIAKVAELDMNRRTRITFSNGDSFEDVNWNILRLRDSYKGAHGETAMGYYVSWGDGDYDGISSHKGYLTCRYIKSDTSIIRFDWAKIEVNVD